MHFNRLVASPVMDAGGFMLVAPPGSLKTQLLMHLSRSYPTTCICDSNWHFGKLCKMRHAFYNGTLRSIIVPEFAAIYAGDPRTGSRLESLLMQMAGEGSMSTNEKDSRWERYEMRASVFGALTADLADKKNPDWDKSGFHRRFLWAHIAMENEQTLMDWLTAGKQVDLFVPPIIEPAERYIPDSLTYEDKQFIRNIIEDKQNAFGPNHTRFVFLCRTISVLKWNYKRLGRKQDWKETITRFSSCLGKDKAAALLVVPDEPTAIEWRKKQEQRLVQAQLPKPRRRKNDVVPQAPALPVPEETKV